MRVKLLLTTGATILSLIAGAIGGIAVFSEASPADVERPAPKGARTYGIIDTIQEGALTTYTPIGPVTLITDVNTRYHVPGVKQAVRDDLAVGDPVGAIGWWEKEGGEPTTLFHAFVVGKLEDERALPLIGELIAVDVDRLTVETPGGPATLHVSDETRILIPGIEHPTLADLELGTKIAAKGTLQDDGSLLARVVTSTERGPRQGRLVGEVVAIAGDTLTLSVGRVQGARRPARPITIQTDEETAFRVPDVADATMADIQVGDRVAVEGMVQKADEASSQPTARATLVIVLPEEIARLNGEVSAIDGTLLVLETASGTVNVLTNEETIFRVRGVEDADLGDITVGDQVTAGGTWEDEGTFRAIAVGVVGGRREGQRGTVKGRVISIQEDSLLVGTPRGPVTVQVDRETRFRMRGAEDVSIDDVEMGDTIGARGTWRGDNTLQANVIGIRPVGR